MISGHQEFFFLPIWWAGYFFSLFPISFLLHLCCTQFSSSDKRLQEIFFQNHPPPPLPSRVKWSAPNPDGLQGGYRKGIFVDESTINFPISSYFFITKFLIIFPIFSILSSLFSNFFEQPCRWTP